MQNPAAPSFFPVTRYGPACPVPAALDERSSSPMPQSSSEREPQTEPAAQSGLDRRHPTAGRRTFDTCRDKDV